MTKVEHTKTKRVANINNGFSVNEASREVLVTDAELMLVAESRSVELVETRSINVVGAVKIKGIWYKPILISRTEKIEVGDWFLRDSHIHQATKFTKYHELDAKILSLPEHFSPQQLQAIVDGKLKEGSCLVECFEVDLQYICKECGEKITRGYRCKNLSHNEMNIDDRHKKIKLNPHITIYPIEKKMYTREEVESYLYELAFWCGNVTRKSVMEWFEQNVK